jgi:hypothetical protein
MNYPRCDAEVRRLADHLWGSGKIRDISLQEAFDSLGLQPDFMCVNKTAPVLHIHRRVQDTDIYFICNQSSELLEADFLLRIRDKTPELWHPDTGRIEDAPVYSQEGSGDNARTRLHLALDPIGSLFVVFRKDHRLEHATSVQRVLDNSPVARPELLIIRHATYGSLDGSRVADVTREVAALAQDGVLQLTVQNTLFGPDPAPRQEKQLTIRYTLDGRDAEKSAREGCTISLISTRSQSAPVGAALRYGRQDTLELISARRGNYLIQGANSKIAKVEVSDVPSPLELDDNWDVTFPAGRGAPAQITLPKLISWHLHQDSGVRYFSGTAVYSKEFIVPPDMLTAGGCLHLHLGDVQVLAEVQVNGRDLGILWKLPFRIDVTDVLKPGANDLRIAVTNLWPNRLIGDEQLAPDAEWVAYPWTFGKGIKAWPQWLTEGKPSPTGRFTFTTWQAWQKEDPLFPSGLIGPVVLQRSLVIPVRLQ